LSANADTRREDERWEDEGGRVSDGREPTLDWNGFSRRFFPDSRRHDFEAVLAYDANRRLAIGL
jgi:hypothetical protein